VKPAQKHSQEAAAAAREAAARDRREKQQALFRQLNQQMMGQLERSQAERHRRRVRARMTLGIVGGLVLVVAAILAFRLIGSGPDKPKPPPVPKPAGVVKSKPAAAVAVVKTAPEQPDPPKDPPAPPPEPPKPAADNKPAPPVKPPKPQPERAKAPPAPKKPEKPKAPPAPKKPGRAKAPPAPKKPEKAKAPPPAPTKAKASKETRGRLRLTVTPPVKVLLDGRELGKTPLTTEVPAGSVDLELVEPYLGIRVTRRVWIRGGELTVQNWKLGRGKLVVSCKPSVTVWVDKGEHGPSPATIELYVGSHVVELVSGGRRVRRNITVRPGRTTRVKCPRPPKADTAEPPDDPGISG